MTGGKNTGIQDENPWCKLHHWENMPHGNPTSLSLLWPSSQHFPSTLKKKKLLKIWFVIVTIGVTCWHVLLSCYTCKISLNITYAKRLNKKEEKFIMNLLHCPVSLSISWPRSLSQVTSGPQSAYFHNLRMFINLYLPHWCLSLPFLLQCQWIPQLIVNPSSAD